MRRSGVWHSGWKFRFARLGALTAVAFVALATVTASAFAITGHKFAGTYDVAPTGGVAVNDATHDVFVADGTGITRVSGDVPAPFVAGGSFGALAVNSTSGNVYAVDPTAKAVNVYDSTGAPLDPLDGTTVTADFFNPTAVAVHPTTKDVYVANVDPDFIQPAVIDVFDSAGVFQMEIPGPVEMPFSSPSGLALDATDNLYVFDGGNVNRYSTAGAFRGTVYGEFSASGVAVDATTGDVFVAALSFVTFTQEVRDYDSTGALVYSFGSGDSIFSVSGMGVDGTSSRVFVGNSGTNVVYYDPFTVPEPSVTTGAATNVKTFSATLNGTVNPNENVATNWHFEYGTTTAYDQQIPLPDAGPLVGSTDQPVSAALTGLAYDTTYHYRLVADRGTGPVNGLDQTFTTLPPVATAAVSLPTDVTKTSATLHGTIDNLGFDSTYFFTVKATDSPYVGSTPQTQLTPAAGPQAVSGALSDLPIGGGFEVRLVVTTGGGTAISEPLGFRTQDSVFVPLSPPVVNNAPYGCTSPHLNAYSAKARPGKAITLTGSDLGVGGVVSFGSSLADADSWGANAIQVVVPSDARGSAAVKVDCSRESNTINVGIAKAKAKKCKRGYVKKKVNGKTRCVKKKAAKCKHGYVKKKVNGKTRCVKKKAAKGKGNRKAPQGRR